MEQDAPLSAGGFSCSPSQSRPLAVKADLESTRAKRAVGRGTPAERVPLLIRPSSRFGGFDTITGDDDDAIHCQCWVLETRPWNDKCPERVVGRYSFAPFCAT
ncbi:hypothetical protein MTO96_022602 [Rhipicephalus appendiculatus]